MISDQDKQRIEEAAREHVSQWHVGNSDHKTRKLKQFFKEDFISGAEYEHPIAYNKALEDFDFILLQKEDYLHGDEGKLITELRKELKKLKK